MSDEGYFRRIEADLDEAVAVARRARQQGGDPEADVEIPVAQDMADRVEKVLGIDGVAERVRELDGETSREAAALALVEDFVAGTVGDYDTDAGKIEGAVRTAVALLTEGVVAAPIEGIDRVEIRENDDGTRFVSVAYAGPIRSAGGTAQALSVLVADYARTLLGVDEYKPRREEIERYAEEVGLYDDETGLQYSPSDAETKYITEHTPIMLDGEPTGEEEVSGYRDLERIDTNNPRGGMCLVLAEGIALKAPKIRRYTRDLEGVEWPWLGDLIDGTVGKGDEGGADDPDRTDEAGDAEGDGGGADAGGDGAGPDADGAGDGDDGNDGDGGRADGETGTDAPPRVDPAKKYLRDLIAGRPVFGHPSEPGGFRLRYGRARNHGFATAGVHPATMRLVDDFLATGTQIKTERPGKAAGVVPVDSIEGPTVRLANGEVRRIDDPGEARELRNGVEAILDLGEYLVNYGEFVENNHPLAPASYTVEWWVQEFEAAGADVQAMRDSVRVDLTDPSPAEAIAWATDYDAPLHPTYTYLWHDLPVEGVAALAGAIDDGRIVEGAGTRQTPPGRRGRGDRTVPDAESEGGGDLVLPRTPATREALEVLLVEHVQREDTLVVPEWRPLVRSLGFDGGLERGWTLGDLPARAREHDGGENAIRVVNAVAPFTVRERAPTRIGSRMGRPEKSEKRELSPAVHTLFPIGEAGGDQRDVAKAAAHADSMRDTPGEVEVQVGRRACTECGTRGFEARCAACGGVTEPVYECPDCEIEADPDEAGRAECPRCGGDATPVHTRTIDVHDRYRSALDAVGARENAFDVLKGVKGLTSAEKVPEPVEKGVLRAKHGVSAFKDGTVRYDMTDLPVTAVRPEELDVTADRFRALGYETDVHGDPLEHDDQLVSLKVQDVVLSDGAAEHMLATADFVDDLLERYYGLDPFYGFDDRDDLVGELVFGMAPHTSAAVVGRVVGFTTAAVGYAHPYFHAAKRRNCFHPDTKVWYEDADGAWHHERIETLVEEHLDDPREDDFGTLIEEVDGKIRVPSLTDAGDLTRKPVEAVSKHPAPDHMIAIRTRSGREVTVTPDHSMVRWDGGIEHVRAHELVAGDEIPVVSDETSLGGESADAPRPTARPTVRRVDGGRPEVQTVERVETVTPDLDHTYSVTVGDTHRLVANGIHTGQCDGDEDCVMLLMDGLLNFSKKYLPDQRGGSVAEDSRLVAVGPDDEVRFLSFGEFWDELESPLEVDGKFRKRTCANEGWRTYVFDEDHGTSLQPIERAIRYPAGENDDLIRVETQFGRSLELTEHHSLFRYDGGIEEVAGADLSSGDLIVAPRNLDIDTDETTVDVAECLDDPYVVIDDRVEDLLRTAWETTERGSPTHEAFGSGLSYRLSKRKISLERFERILGRAGFSVPRDAKIGLPGSSNGIFGTIEIDDEFGWLLGLFVADGTLSSVCPAIHNADSGLIDRAAGIIERKLGHEPGRRWTNRAYELRFPAVFREILYDLGFEDRESYDSSEKIVPDSILRAPRGVVLAFLRGFLAGDGSESSDDNVSTIGFHTTSADVKDGVVFLLHRLGLVANVSERTDRDGNRQDIFTVTVSGGATENPLRRILDGDDPYYPKSLVVRIPDTLLELREMDIEGVKRIIPKYLLRRENVSLEKLGSIVAKLDARQLPDAAEERMDRLRPLVEGDLSYLRVERVERVDYDGYLYDLQVGGEPVFVANWLYAHNSMDAPLVMTSRIDPTEIDDEAHNVDIVDRYPLELYEASRRLADPEKVDVTIAGDTLETDRQYDGFAHTHDTSNVAAGPDLSAYKTLGSMEEKMDAQLELARKLRAVDETDVAERIIEYHFLPDLIGNLRAFSRQETRCLDCGEKYRRMPLSKECRVCGGDVNLTVHEGSVSKYLSTATRVAEEYGAREYTKQRLEILERSIESIFEDDTNKQSGIGDFM